MMRVFVGAQLSARFCLEEGPGRAAVSPSPLPAVPTVTAHLINGQCTNFIFDVALYKWFKLMEADSAPKTP